MVATSNGYDFNEEVGKWIDRHVDVFNRLGFCVYIPEYDNGISF